MMLFFDTYAFIEIIKGNINYKKYKDYKKITTRYNLLELYYSLLRNVNKNYADDIFNLYLKYTIPIPIDVYPNASLFKLKHKKKKLSYVDCVGYIISRKFGVKFLTGDKEFRTMENVEFVK